MTRFNNWGLAYTDLLRMYPGTIVADYDGGGANGQTVIEDSLARISREVASALTPEVYEQMQHVDAELIVRYATEGQASATLGLSPSIAGTLHLWRYPSEAILGYTDASSSLVDEYYFKKPCKGINELVLNTDYTVSAETVTFTGASLSLGERVFATYDVDLDDEDFAMPSLADISLLGSAAELGSRLYSEGTQEWALVTGYRDRYNAAMAAMKDGAYVPDEMRALSYWVDIEAKSNQVRSVRMYRS